MRVALPKVFGIGLGKTGTTSLHEALTIVGWRSTRNPPAEIIRRVFAGDLGWYNAFSDNPIQTHLPRARCALPESKFVYTTRPFEDRVASRIRHRNAWGAPGWEFDPAKLREW